MRKLVLFLGIFCALVTACKNDGTVVNPLPEFVQVSGPQLFGDPPVTTDVNYKVITAIIDPKEATAFDVSLKYWVNNDSSSTIGEIVDCNEQDGNLSCTYEFTNGLTVYPLGAFFEDDSTVSYQWYIISSSPDLPDAILAESEVTSFTIVAPKNCNTVDDCPNDPPFSCRQDSRSPTMIEDDESYLFSMVCALTPIPEPGGRITSIQTDCNPVPLMPWEPYNFEVDVEFKNDGEASGRYQVSLYSESEEWIVTELLPLVYITVEPENSSTIKVSTNKNLFSINDVDDGYTITLVEQTYGVVHGISSNSASCP